MYHITMLLEHNIYMYMIEIKIINIIYDVVLLISTSSMAYERTLDSVLWYTRVWGILYVAYSYLTYVNVEVSGKNEMQLIIAIYRYWYHGTISASWSGNVAETKDLAIFILN